MLLGLALLGVEIFTPGGFFLMFFGVAALIVGGVQATALGAAFGGTLAAQVLLFTVLSGAGIVLFRRTLVARFGRPHSVEVDSLIGARAVALETLPAGGPGKVELRGTPWNARNSGMVEVMPGQSCTVERVDGLTLWVRIAAEEYLAQTRPKESIK